jgi:hypothetical protein
MVWLGIISLGLTAEMAMIVALGRSATYRYESETPVVRPGAAASRRPANPLVLHPREPAPMEPTDPMRIQ